MKKIITILSIFILFSSCEKLEDLNENTKDPANVSGESLFTGAQKNLLDQMVNTNVNFNVFRLFAQYWTETTYTDESNYDLFTRTIPDNHWSVLYRDVLKDFDESGKIITTTVYPVTESPLVKQNKLAIVEVMTVYTYSILVETFGNVPYNEALNVDILLPEYDDGLTVYKDLLDRLNVAIAQLDPSEGSFGLADNLYQGDVAAWIKFANSLKLRMGMLLSDVDETAAEAAIVAAAPHVFTSNSDNAALVYSGASPNTNPLYADLVASGRHDFVPTSRIIDVMNDLEDPRRPFYFTLYEGAYVGGEYGMENDFTTYSHIADRIQEPIFEGTILDYSEVEFLLAEAVERGFAVGGTAEGHYNNAIEASITYWGGTEAEVSDYLANTQVAYSTAEGNFKEKIGTQKWLALYNRGFEAWTEWRRLDYPILVAPPDALSVVPLRYTYPIAEQTLNGANYNSASDAIGGDDVATRLFWDVF